MLLIFPKVIDLSITSQLKIQIRQIWFLRDSLIVMGNTVSSSDHDAYIKNHADSSQAEKKAATKAIIKKLKEILQKFVSFQIFYIKY